MEQNPKQKSPEQFSDILMVLDKENEKIHAVKGITKKGALKTVSPDKKNQNQFIRVDKHGDVFSNFISNFKSQLKNPTRFLFFIIPEATALQKTKKLEHSIKSPIKDNRKPKSGHNVHKQKNHHTMETTQTTPETSDYRYQVDQIDWKTISELGLSKEKLEKMNLLDPLLKGYKTTSLVPISIHMGTAITRTDARLSLQPNDKGQIVMAVHGIRKEPALDYPFFGHEFSPEDKKNLQQTGNMGRIVDLYNSKTGETIPSIVSVDRLTNELIALRAEWIKIPDVIKGVKLNEDQKQSLMEGKPIHLEGMISKKGTPFNAEVQFNADKRYVEFLFDKKTFKQTQSETLYEAPRNVRGKELDEAQYKEFKEGKTIYVDDLVSKDGKEYKGYLTFNKETGKTDFNFGKTKKINDKEKIKTSSENKSKENLQTKKPVKQSGKVKTNTKQVKPTSATKTKSRKL